MKVQKVEGQCIGAFRLCAIDNGFDLRSVRYKIELPDADEWPDYLQTPGPIEESGVGFDTSHGRAIVWGTRDEVVRVLRRAGYRIARPKKPKK